MEAFLKSVRKIVPRGLADTVRPAYHFALAVVGECIYRFPGRQLTVIGVTGTNGKSTSANLIAKVLEAGGHQVGLATTVNFKIGDKEWANESKMTSPGRFAAYRLLRQMVNAGCTHAVLEVSSHALHWHRVWGIPFQTAVFTNLTRDHLDLHQTMEAYRNTKGKLFASLKSGRKSVAVVNGDDPEASYFLKCFADTKYVYGLTPAAAEVLPLAHTVKAEEIRSGADGSSFTVVTESGTFPAMVHLPGRFNVANALAAVSVGLAHGVDQKEIAYGLESLTGVPGRMQKVEAGQPFAIIVDYAHTPDAFDNVLKTLREVTTGRLIVVFGAAGDRDRGKRPDLGKVAATYADRMVLTEEDPASEDPAAIIGQIVPGIEAAGKGPDDYVIELDRRRAIAQALADAKAGDTVVLLAIGHQTQMVRADGPHPWHEPTVAAEEYKRLAQ